MIGPGATLGSYRIVALLGRGGMATVYKAYQPRLARYVAIKVLPAYFAEDPTFAERFEQEAITIARLEHPHILTVFEFGDEQGIPYLVTPLIDSGTLADRAGTAIAPAQVAAILRPIASALDYAHSLGVLHRDVKPSNVLLRRDGTPVLADFGIAKMMDQPRGITRTGAVVGTPEYMAPEQAMGEPATPAGDHYALAVVAYELLTGQVPFSAETPMATLLAHVQAPLPPLRSVNPALPEAIEDVLLKGLAKQAQDRYPTGSAFISALTSATGGDIVTGFDAFATAGPPSSQVVPVPPDLAQPIPTPEKGSTSPTVWQARTTAPPTVMQDGATEPTLVERINQGDMSPTLVAAQDAAPRQAASAEPAPTTPKPETSTLAGAPPTVVEPRQQVAVPASSVTTSRQSAQVATAPLPASTPSKQPPWLLIGGAAIGLVAILGVVGFVATRGGSSSAKPVPPTRVVAGSQPAAFATTEPIPTATSARPATATPQAPVLPAQPTLAATPLPTRVSTTTAAAVSGPSQLMTQRRASAAAVALQNGKVMLIGGIGEAATTTDLYDPTTNTWSAGPRLTASRSNPKAVVLKDGKVLALGGTSAPSAELYDPAANAWTQVGPPPHPEAVETATLLADGKVLTTTIGQTSAIFDPTTSQWTRGANETASPKRESHTATLLQNGKVLIIGRQGTELYDPTTGGFTAASPMATPRSSHTATLLPNGQVIVIGGTSNIIVTTVERYDPATNAWSSAGTMTFYRYGHTATLLKDGKVLVSGGTIGSIGDNAELYDPASGKFAPAGRMLIRRGNHTATLLKDGKVLVAGGRIGVEDLNVAELYDPNANVWDIAGATPASMATSPNRSEHTATLLSSGKVLVAGGSDGRSILATALLYDPASRSWAAAGKMTAPHAQHTATLLPNGKVLVMGGVGTRAVDVYDPAANTWTSAAPMTRTRYKHTATLLPNGKILVVGDAAPPELFDLEANAWTTTSPALASHFLQSATLLGNGKVLVAGGIAGASTPAELYDPAANKWSAAANPGVPRTEHVALALPNGKALFAGGSTSRTGLVAELYDPNGNSWTGAGSMGTDRFALTATLLRDGKALVTGGIASATELSSAELYDPATNGWSPASVMPGARFQHTATLLPNGQVLVVGGEGAADLPVVIYDPAANAWTTLGRLG
jgi:serine/threonine protein kinase/N-acetylneuraminic acid mutarotase